MIDIGCQIYFILKVASLTKSIADCAIVVSLNLKKKCFHCSFSCYAVLPGPTITNLLQHRQSVTQKMSISIQQQSQ